MGADWLGGGLVIALAAVLWLVYLLPSWFRRNEYMATEKNAVRLQQTLRVLAETAEVPEEIRVEANARSVVEQQRRLKKVIMDNTPTALIQAAKIKRSRALTSLLLLLAVITTVLGSLQIALTGAWLVMMAGALVSAVCVLRLVKLAKMGRSLKLPAVTVVSAPKQAPEFTDHGADFVAEEAEEEEVRVAEWTPVEIPRPLYLTRRAPSVSTGSGAQTRDRSVLTGGATPAEELLAAAARAQEVLRQAELADAAHREREVETVAPVFSAPAPTAPSSVATARVESAAVAASAPPAATTASASPSRYASMGVVGEDIERLDLDKIMARRRAG